MLLRASVGDLKRGEVKRGKQYIVVVMRYYPRFLRKEKLDEYISALAPSKDLFAEFKKYERDLRDHDLAFEKVEYEKRFSLSDDGRLELERLSEISHKRDVALICQCQAEEDCHADLLLLWAQRHFEAKIATLHRRYLTFEKRLELDLNPANKVYSFKDF